jgi:hypothetical protein
MLLQMLIDVGPLKLMEPMTFLTDVVTGIFCFIFAKHLHKINPNKVHNWKLYFVFMGLSSFIGGFAHLLYHYTGLPLKVIAWSFVGFSVFFGQLATFSLFKSKKWINFWTIIAGIQTITYLVLLVIFQHFNVSKIEIVVWLVFIVLPIQIWYYFKYKNPGNKVIVLGLISAISLAFIHGAKLTIDKNWFNHNDISHVVMLGCLYIVYRGALILAKK